jgi:hypothetical protein
MQIKTFLQTLHNVLAKKENSLTLLILIFVKPVTFNVKPVKVIPTFVLLVKVTEFLMVSKELVFVQLTNLMTESQKIVFLVILPVNNVNFKLVTVKFVHQINHLPLIHQTNVSVQQDSIQ